METTVKEETKTTKKVAKSDKPLEKKHKLSELFGCFKGQIFYDDAVFNLEMR